MFNLKEFRTIALRKTQKEFATAIGMLQCTYSRLESNPGSMTLDEFQRIIDIFEITSIDSFLKQFGTSLPSEKERQIKKMELEKKKNLKIQEFKIYINEILNNGTSELRKKYTYFEGSHILEHCEVIEELYKIKKEIDEEEKIIKIQINFLIDKEINLERRKEIENYVNALYNLDKEIILIKIKKKKEDNNKLFNLIEKLRLKSLHKISINEKIGETKSFIEKLLKELDTSSTDCSFNDLTDLNLSARSFNMLMRNGITLEKLKEMNYNEIISLHEIGKKSCEEIIEKRNKFFEFNW